MGVGADVQEGDAMSGYQYIRDYYGFPARRGLVVEYEGKRGVVTGVSGPHLRVKLHGETISKPYHPDDLKWKNLGVPRTPKMEPWE